MNSQVNVSDTKTILWRLRQLHHGRWEDNDDPALESALSFAASTKLQQLMESMPSLLLAWCPQSIESFKVVDKTLGEISLQWYGPVFELDIDISVEGQLGFLLHAVGAPREQWLSGDDVTAESIGEAMLKVMHETAQYKSFR